MNKQNGHIFISYAREDRGRVAILAKLLADEGWSVWWDRDNLPAGQQFHRVIEQAIQDASCVLVCWSEAAIKSDWVLGEADEAKKKNKFLPLLLETVEPPMNFRNRHYVDLTDWDDKASHAAYQRLKAELTKRQPLTKSDVPTQKPVKPKHSKPIANQHLKSELPKIQPLTKSDVPAQKPAESKIPKQKAYPANVQKLIDRLDNPFTKPEERLSIGDKLAKLGDPRPGVGLDKNGLPDINWVKIPRGEFLYDEDKESRKIKPFFIAKYPITNEQYEVFINHAGYRDNRWWKDLSERIAGPESPEWNQPNRPRETVSWYESIAFCRWLSQQLGYTVQLPTEEQWERAARGTDGREYPWGNEYVPGYANINEKMAEKGPHYLEQTSAVGLYPSGATSEGILDLVGNVWEWNLNEYNRPGNTALEGNAPRVLRGGSWFYYPGLVCASIRSRYDPVIRINLIGFRVVCSSPIPR